MKGGEVLHHVRRLRTLVDRQSCFGGVPVCYYRARLKRHPRVPSKDEIRFHNFVGTAKAASTAPASRLRSKARLSPSEA